MRIRKKKCGKKKENIIKGSMGEKCGREGGVNEEKTEGKEKSEEKKGGGKPSPGLNHCILAWETCAFTTESWYLIF